MLQREVGAQLGVDKTTIGNWERNLVAPALRHGPGITEFLGYVPLECGDSLPERLKAYRWRHGVTQRQLADVIGVDELAVRTWESRQKRPNATNEGRLKKLLDD